MTKINHDVEFQALYDKALEAGRAAGVGSKPTPMIVGQAKGLFSNEIDYSKPTYYESEGLCGFAWVNIKPGNSPFANWLKKKKLADKSYYGGVDIWISDYNQSYERKSAHATAMARVLSLAGIRANSMSRLD